LATVHEDEELLGKVYDEGKKSKGGYLPRPSCSKLEMERAMSNLGLFSMREYSSTVYVFTIEGWLYKTCGTKWALKIKVSRQTHAIPTKDTIVKGPTPDCIQSLRLLWLL